MVALQSYNVFQYQIVTNQLVANFVLVSIATVLVVLRFVARKVRRTDIWFDDWWATSSLVYTFGMLAMHITYAKYGMRHHMAELPPQNQMFIAKQLVAYQAVYYAAMATVKQSYLFFYLRIFPNKEFKVWVWVCMFLVGGYWLGSMLQIFLICSPFEMNWNPTIPGGHCASYNVAFTTIGCVNMVTDLIIMLLPLPFIRNLQMAIGTKIGLYVIFLIGLFVTAITIIRIHVLSVVDFTDLSYSMHDAAFWSVAEPAVAIINSCIPTMRPLLKLISPSRLWSSHKASTYGPDSRYGNGRSGNGGTGGAKMDSHKAFERMQDGEYPLTQFEGGASTNVAIIEVSRGGSSDGESSLRRETSGHRPASGGWQALAGQQGISVRREVQVESNRAESVRII
ncbi:putative integral membrane protein [Neofusicoccum parvum]|uniref:Integral membrane protein n=1 Tax=Neofusicoccum parvum TaxID=310453 RepID=A0ACB5RW23_9PEZI|nr:putative integral membrane protein [Neofusicoccum parvum]